MTKQYHWEVQPAEEVDPHFVFTEADSVVEASRQFENAWGKMSIMYIRKIGVSKKFEYPDDFGEVS